MKTKQQINKQTQLPLDNISTYKYLAEANHKLLIKFIFVVVVVA